MFDVAIIGGGAAGLYAAVSIKKKNINLKIAVIEQLDRVGRKISVTGNGRCNISNKEIKPENYYSENPEIVTNMLFNGEKSEIEELFHSIGIDFISEGNKLFPSSLQASSVTDALRFAADSLKVTTLLNTKVTKLEKKKSFLIYCTENDNKSIIEAESVIMATGGLAGGSKLGSTGAGYEIMKSFNHKVTKLFPAIVQLKTENTLTKRLKGIKVNCQVKTQVNGKPITENGEVLFCDYGLSGPPVLQISRYFSANKAKKLSLDLFPEKDLSQLTLLLSERRDNLYYLKISDFFTGLLNKRLGQELIRTGNIGLSENCSELSDNNIARLAETCKNLTFSVTGNTGYINAQTTLGGAVLSDFDSTLQSKKVNGLFAAGEVLDCAGDCGGYNLFWAFKTAEITANAVLKYLEINNK